MSGALPHIEVVGSGRVQGVAEKFTSEETGVKGASQLKVRQSILTLKVHHKGRHNRVRNKGRLQRTKSAPAHTKKT